MEKLDLKKRWKHLYQPAAGVIATADVPPRHYPMVDGQGDPNRSAAFQEAVEALYALSYALKFSQKKGPRAIDYGVMPLEGLRWADGPAIQRIHEFIHAAGKELRGQHHEIYRNDLRRTAPEKLKTILRQPMG